jgi:hypothetical protein
MKRAKMSRLTLRQFFLKVKNRQAFFSTFLLRYLSNSSSAAPGLRLTGYIAESPDLLLLNFINEG